MSAQNLFHPRVRSVMKEHIENDEKKAEQWGGTIIVTQCSPKQGNMIGYSGSVQSLDDKLLIAGYYLAEMGKSDPDTSLSDQVLLSVHSTFLGTPNLFKKISKVYHHPDDERKLPENRHFQPISRQIKNIIHKQSMTKESKTRYKTYKQQNTK